MGTLLGIATRTASRAEMITVDEASVTTESGVADDFRGRPGPRQVTVVVREAWDEACRSLDTSVPWVTRRANLLVEGVTLREATGRRLEVGDVILEITGETAPCNRMEEQCEGLREALVPDWRGGVTCRVVQEGRIRIGDPVSLHDGEG